MSIFFMSVAVKPPVKKKDSQKEVRKRKTRGQRRRKRQDKRQKVGQAKWHWDNVENGKEIEKDKS